MLSIKDVRGQGGRGLSSADILRTDMDVRSFWCKKTSDLSKFMVCPHEQGGLKQCGHFADKREGVNFSRFCADVFYRRPLT